MPPGPPLEGQLVLGEDPRAAPPAQDPGPFEDPEEERFRENLERITGIVGRSLMIGIPTFFLILALLLPAWAYVRGPGGVTIAFLGAAGAAWALERWRGRNRPRTARAPAAAPSGPWRLALAGVGLLAVVYIVFVLIVSR